MQQKTLSRQRRHQQGQTILLVAISMVSLLAMAALAIDIVTLYVARSEIQRAADAAALAAAKAIADSGVTTLDAGNANLPAAKLLAQNMATAAVTALVNPSSTLNLVAGTPPTLATITPIPIDFSRQGNPHVTITLQRANLPTFFSKVWGASPPSAAATATAEAYNPANLSTITRIAPLNVKPWLVANADPTGTALHFVDTASPNWVVDSGVIGQSFDLVSACKHGGPNKCRPVPNPPHVLSGPPNAQVQYVPAVVSTLNTQNVCPACAAGGDYERSIGCVDVATSYQVLNCGGGAAQAQWDDGINPGPPPGNNATSQGGQCLIHASSEGSGGQDVLTEPGIIFSAPYQIKQQGGSLVTTSNSIVAIPIIDTTNPLVHGGGAVTVVGFLQAFVNQVDATGGGAPEGSINITVLNIAGCSAINNGANPVVGASATSPVPVRLITPP